MECSFTVNRKELVSTLAHFRKVVKSAKKQDTILEATITDGALTLNIPGGELNVQAKTKGTAKFVIKLWYFADVVSSFDYKELNLLLTEDTLKISNTLINVHTTFFKDDSILRSINLPLNFNHVDLYRLKHSGKYTELEIEFNKLTGTIEDAILQIKVDIDEVYRVLKKYGYSKKEITEIIMAKLNEEIPKSEDN